MALDSMKEIFDRMEQEGKPFWEIVLETDMDERQVTRNQSMAKMLITWQAMSDAADSYTGQRRSVSGLVGGDGMKMRQYCLRGEAMSGGYISEVIAEALSMAESNACMCRIVAAPTAGACGVLPAVLLPLCKYEELSQHQLLEALYVASGIGAVIAYRACIAGASGGCQAEIPRVRKDFGYPPLVTPSSQIVGTQAVMNIIMGERYKTFPKESRAMLKGEYGKLPGEVNEGVRAKAGIAPEDVITCRPADLLEPELEKYRTEYKDIAKSDEDVLSLALFPQVAPKFIEKRDHPAAAPAAAPAAPKPAAVRELYVEWKG